MTDNLRTILATILGILFGIISKYCSLIICQSKKHWIFCNTASLRWISNLSKLLVRVTKVVADHNDLLTQWSICFFHSIYATDLNFGAKINGRTKLSTLITLIFANCWGPEVVQSSFPTVYTLYTHHYNPRFVYLLPHIWSPFLCFQGVFFS